MSPPIPLPNHCIDAPISVHRCARALAKLPRGAARAHYRGFESRRNETTALAESLCSNRISRGLQLIARGKVRDIYRVDAERLLIVATDRMSAFDVVLPDPIPGKGVVLTSISNFWFDEARERRAESPHGHGARPSALRRRRSRRRQDRAVVVRKLKPLPVEAVVRGYLIGSGWKDYCKTGRVSGVALPPGSSSRNACASRSSRRAPKPRPASTTRTSRWPT